MSTWSSLPQELALLVSRHMSTADMLQARAACTDWRSAFKLAPAALVPLTLDAELLNGFPGATGLDLLSRHASRHLTPDSVGLPASFKELASLMVSGATLTDSVAEELLHVVQRCTGLESLVLRTFNVDDSQRAVPATLAAVAGLPRLRQLKLQCLWLPIMPCTVLHPCTVLQELTLEGVDSLDDNDAAFHTLCEACPRLRKLSLQPHGQWKLRTYRPLASLGGLSDVLLRYVEADDAALEDIGHGCPHLTKLHFMDCGMVSASQGMQLSHLRPLRCLKIRCHHSANKAFMHLSYLERLEVSGVHSMHGDESSSSCLFTQLSRGPAAHVLTQLSLPAVLSGKHGLASLAALTALQSLDLRCGQIPMLRDLDVALAGMLQLTCLDLSQLGFQLDGPLAQLSRLTKLRFLSLERPRGRPNTSVSADELAGLSRLQLLEHLNLSGCPVTDAHLPQIACCTGLRSLLLDSAPVSDQGLVALSAFSVLSVLHLDRTPITGSCLQHLPTSLRTLHLSHCRATVSTAMTHMSRLCNLRRLDLNGCAGVTDDVLLGCASCLTAVSALNLTSCKQVTARSLVRIAGMTSLIALNLVCACASVSLEVIKESLSASGADIQYPAGHYSAHVSPAVQRVKRTRAQRSPYPSDGSSQEQPGSLKPRKLF